MFVRMVLTRCAMWINVCPQIKELKDYFEKFICAMSYDYLAICILSFFLTLGILILILISPENP